MKSRSLLVHGVRERLAGTGYALAETEDGFEVRIDVDDASWWSTWRREQGSVTVVHRVRADEQTETLSITDVTHALTWSADASASRPRIGVASAGAVGRVEGRSFRFTLGRAADGSWESGNRFSFDVGAGRELVRQVAAEQGWRERRGLAETVGLAAALVGGLGAIVAVVVVVLVVL